MTFIVDRNAQNVIYPIRILDNAEEPIESLAHDSAGLSIDFKIAGQASWSTVTLSAGTLAQWSKGGFVEQTAGDGWYDLGVPNEAISPGLTTDVRVRPPGLGWRYGSISATGVKNSLGIPSPRSPEGKIRQVYYDIPPLTRGDTWLGMPGLELIDVAGDPVDLTGASIKMQVKENQATETALLEFSTADGITIDNAAGGVFSIGKSDVGVSAGLFVYDVQVTLSNGDRHTVLYGTWRILPDVTR